MTLIAQPTRVYEQNPFLPDTQFDRLYEPKTSAVVGAMVSEAFNGVGTWEADSVAKSIEAANKAGQRIDFETYKNSPYYRAEFPHYAELTEEGAALAAKYIDDNKLNKEIIAKASGGQFALGLGASIILGTAEPKNLLYGGVTAAVGLPLVGVVAPKAGLLRNMLNARRANATYSAKAGLGATEGLVAAAAMEPSNRYSASILQEDYTMMDSLFNIATSSVLGAAIEVAPSYIRDRWNGEPNKVKATDIIAAELDTAVEQMATGKPIDVAAVERAIVGEISSKPVEARARAAETFVRGSEITKVESIQKLTSVAMGEPDVVAPKGTKVATEIPQAKDGLSPAALDSLENPASFIVREIQSARTVMETSNPKVAEKVNKAKYEVVPVAEHLANLNGESYYKGGEARAEAVKQAALGGESVDAITARIDAESAEINKRHIANQARDSYDTSIDEMAINRLEDYEEKLMLDKHIDTLNKMDAYVDELNAMEKQGAISSKELADLVEAIEAVDTDKLQTAWEAARICLTRG
jgi:hypothetical protein